MEELVEPWDWCKEERVISLEGWRKRFYAVEEEEGEWALYYDRDGDELESVLDEQDMLDCAFVPVTLIRKIVEERPPPPPQQQAAPQAQTGQKQSEGKQ